MVAEKNMMIDISGDGQLTKEVLVEGVGEDMPVNGAKVKVHYVGTLMDGSEFDSSRGRGDPFEFTLGQGSVIKGWDQGVATMRLGEKCILTCAPDYAYGASGSPPKIPPNSTLKFEVELLEWNDKEDISNGEGAIMKKTLRAGEGYKKPNSRTKVKILYKGTLEDGTVFIDHTETPFEFVLDEDEMVPTGFEKSIESMKLNEKAKFFVKSSHGYSSWGNKELGVPADASLTYEIELVSMEPGKESWELEKSDKIAISEQKKEQGNRLFKLGRSNEAALRYHSAIEYIKYDTKLETELETRANALRVSCHLNMAACKLKLKENAEAKHACDEALKLEEKNIKALYRRGQAFFEMGSMDEATEDVKKGLAMEPNNPNFKQLDARIRHALKQNREKERKVFGGIFNRPKKVPHSTMEDKMDTTPEGESEQISNAA